jgi:hypothetical protein
MEIHRMFRARIVGSVDRLGIAGTLAWLRDPETEAYRVVWNDDTGEQTSDDTDHVVVHEPIPEPEEPEAPPRGWVRKVYDAVRGLLGATSAPAPMKRLQNVARMLYVIEAGGKLWWVYRELPVTAPKVVTKVVTMRVLPQVRSGSFVMKTQEK